MDRFALLERKLRYQKWAIIVLAALFLFTSIPVKSTIHSRIVSGKPTVAQMPEDTLRISVLEIINSAGTPVLVLSSDVAGNGSLQWYDHQKIRVGALGVGDGENRLITELTLFDFEGDPAIALNSRERTFGSSIGVFSKKGFDVEGEFAVAGMGNLDGVFGFSTFGERQGRDFSSTLMGDFTNEEDPTSLIGSLDDNETFTGFWNQGGKDAQFRVMNSKGKAVVLAGLDSMGDGYLKTFDSDSKPTWESNSAPGDLDGDGDVDFNDFVIFAKIFGSGSK